MNKKYLLSLALILGTSFFVQGVSAETWENPGSTPPADNVSTPINTSSTGQTKLGGLTLNTGNATYGLLIPYGKIGIGTLVPGGIFDVFGTDGIAFTVLANGNTGVGVVTPASKFSVSGGVQLGTDSATCTTAKAGTLRWTGTTVEVCDGSAWSSAGSGGGGDTVAVGSVMGYCEFKDYYGSQGSSPVRSCITSSAAEPAWCATGSNGIANCSCDTGYTVTQKRVVTNQTCGGFFTDCDLYVYVNVCVRNTTDIAASCSATTACPKTKSGDTCVTNSTPSSYTCSATSVTSTCTDGTWSPTPAVYSSCTYGAALSATCGAASGNYAYGSTAFAGTFCGGSGTANPSSQSFPSAGNQASWTCAESGKTTVSCSAYHVPAPIYGCTDPVAENYNASATNDDGSCQYINGCMDSGANNYDPTATRDDGSCTYDE